MFKNSVFSCIGFCLILVSCHSTKVAEMPEIKVYANFVNHQNDTCGDLCRRIVFTHLPCSARKHTGKNGKLLPQLSEGEESDSACFTCKDQINEQAVLFQGIPYKMGFSYMLSMRNAELEMDYAYCSKVSLNLRARFGDSVPFVFWGKLNEKTGRQVFYTARDSTAYPYFVPSTLDSLVYDLSQNCSDDEKSEERKGFQAVIDRYLKVDVTPNPFAESFELTLNAEEAQFVVRNQVLNIAFYDGSGNTLHTQTIEADKPYTFTIPGLKSGSILHYKITWSDYVISGQILKA